MTDAVIVTELEVVKVSEIPRETIAVSDVEVVRPQFNDLLVINNGPSYRQYTHNQIVPADIWTITHNLGHVPTITVFDSANTEVECDYQYLDINTVVLTFSAGFAGTAYLT